jgi:aminoglycoside 2''-phosphotransferase
VVRVTSNRVRLPHSVHRQRVSGPGTATGTLVLSHSMDATDYVERLAKIWPVPLAEDVRLTHGRRDDVVISPPYVFRFPRDEEAVENVKRRARVIRLLSRTDRRFGVLIPDVLLGRLEGEPPGHAFSIEEHIDGEPLKRPSIEALGALSYRFAQQIADVLHAFYALELDDELRACLAPAPKVTGAKKTGNKTLVHGDFTSESLLWDPDESKLVGLLGWGRAHVGDPAYDIASLIVTFGEPFTQTIVELVRYDDAKVLDRARTIAEHLDDITPE